MTTAPSARFSLPAGDDGVDMTVAAAWGLIDAGQSDPRLPAIVAEAVGKTHNTESLAGIFRYAKSSMRFRQDPSGIDTMQTLTAIIDAIERDGFAVGDCVHRAILIASIVKGAGFSPFLVVVGSTPHGRFEHIAAGAILASGWLYPLDPQETTTPGTLPPYQRHKVYRP